MKAHFEDKAALDHVLQKRREGMLSLSETHGTELPGHFSAACDSARETSLVLLLIWFFLNHAHLAFSQIMLILIAIGMGILAWKTGRAACLGWARLERLNRLIEQEKYEIEHHRPQEREELIALYQSKGLEGKLLDDVVDVLMADQGRLLKVMLEEEMGLTLEAHEHPLKQALGAFLGSFLALTTLLAALFLFPAFGMLVASFCVVALSACISAVYERNRILAATIWNVSLAALAYGVAYFIYQIFATL